MGEQGVGSTGDERGWREGVELLTYCYLGNSTKCSSATLRPPPPPPPLPPLTTAYLSCFVSRSSTTPNPPTSSAVLWVFLHLFFFPTRAPFLSSFLFGALSVPRTGLAVCSEIRFGVVRAPRRTAPQSVHAARSAASESRATVRARQISRARAASSACPPGGGGRRGRGGGRWVFASVCPPRARRLFFSTAFPISPSPCNLVIERPRTARDGGPSNRPGTLGGVQVLDIFSAAPLPLVPRLSLCSIMQVTTKWGTFSRSGSRSGRTPAKGESSFP